MLALQDYSALITIADPSQLSQELIDEKLGLNYHVQLAQPSQSARIPVPEEPRSSPPETSSKDNGARSSTPHTVPTPPSAPAQYPLHQPQSQAQMSSFSTSSHSTPISTSSGTAHQYQHSTSSPQRSRHVSESGATSEAHPDRQRKVSLTTRLGKAFGNPAMQGRTSDPAPPSSPGSSPASTSKFKSSISKAFRRTSADAPPHETRAESPGAPPVPPKDEPVSQSTRRPSEGQYRTPSGGMGYSPVSAVPSPRSDSLPQTTRNLQANGNGSPAGSLTPSNVATQNHSTPAETRLSPSPSAQRVFTEARIKSLSQEEEIQSRFRKDLHLDEFGTTDRTAVNLNDDTEEELRLPYDVSDERLSEHAHGKREVTEGSDVIPAALHLGKPIDISTNGASQSPVADERTRQSSHEVADSVAYAMYDPRDTVPASSVGLFGAATRHPPHQDEVSSDHEGRNLAAAAETAHPEEAEEDRRRPEEQALALAEEEESTRRAREAEDAERTRVEEEEAERSRLEGEETARQERLRAEDEARRAREAEARRILEEEERRILEEEEARQKEEEEEKLRIALEEQRRIEEARLREEEERQRVEEEHRVRAEKEEAERIRKDNIKQSLLDGKSSGGVMLRGVSHTFRYRDISVTVLQFVTVQTTKSPIWRRRYFHLQSGELRLFKSEAVSS